MEGKDRREQLNNKGFTLVEVLVAVLILAIVAGPVLSSLVTSIRVNAKAKEQQRLNAAAESIMEGFKAYDFDQLEDQFSTGDINDCKVIGSMLTDTNAVIKAVNACSVAVSSTSWDYKETDPIDGSVTTTRYQVPTGTFKLQEINYENKNYDATVELSLYKETDDSGAVTYDGTSQISYIENMNGYQDCVYLQQLNEMTENYYNLLTDVATELNTVDKIYGKSSDGRYLGGYMANNLDMDHIEVSRSTVVTIDDTKVNVSVTYSAKIVDYPYYLTGASTANLNKTISLAPITEDFYNNTDVEGASLDNVFLFIYPAYKSSASGYPFYSDTYSITNTGSEKKVFFVKQKNTTIADLNTCEQTYAPSITVSNVDLYHNLKDNLGGGSTTGFTGITAVGGANIIEGISIPTAQVMLYKITVTIYEDGAYAEDFADAGKVLYKLEGTMNND